VWNRSYRAHSIHHYSEPMQHQYRAKPVPLVEQVLTGLISLFCKRLVTFQGGTVHSIVTYGIHFWVYTIEAFLQPFFVFLGGTGSPPTSFTFSVVRLTCNLNWRWAWVGQHPPVHHPKNPVLGFHGWDETVPQGSV